MLRHGMAALTPKRPRFEMRAKSALLTHGSTVGQFSCDQAAKRVGVFAPCIGRTTGGTRTLS